MKLLQSHLYQEPENVAAVPARGEAAQAMRVRNVVQVLESAVSMRRCRTSRWSACDGKTSRTRCGEHRRLSIRRSLKLVREVARGLEAARAAGIVHRDLKPRNLFLAEATTASIWKILDFGVSKLARRAGHA